MHKGKRNVSLPPRGRRCKPERREAPCRGYGRRPGVRQRHRAAPALARLLTAPARHAGRLFLGARTWWAPLRVQRAAGAGAVATPRRLNVSINDARSATERVHLSSLAISTAPTWRPVDGAHDPLPPWPVERRPWRRPGGDVQGRAAPVGYWACVSDFDPAEFRMSNSRSAPRLYRCRAGSGERAIEYRPDGTGWELARYERGS